MGFSFLEEFLQPKTLILQGDLHVLEIINPRALHHRLFRCRLLLPYHSSRLLLWQLIVAVEEISDPLLRFQL